MYSLESEWHFCLGATFGLFPDGCWVSGGYMGEVSEVEEPETDEDRGKEGKEEETACGCHNNLVKSVKYFLNLNLRA